MDPQRLALFRDGVQAYFNSWSAYQLAVRFDAGGPKTKEKAEWFVNSMVQFFTENKNLDSDEVADLMENILDEEFDTLIEDGSLEEVGEKLCSLYGLVESGKLSEVHHVLRGLKVADVSHSRSANIEESSSEDEEDRDLASSSATQTTMILNTDDLDGNEAPPLVPEQQHVSGSVGVEQMDFDQNEGGDDWVQVKPKGKKR